ncbi:MAG TPA: prenyltransferase/squalene oxidase repeat-containing protein [Streptosporangiaceae bacterium]|nr:prenyltransferase/squalene oxidase repeat-containing protein [Streptosporangiaceae bacterium]
MTGTTADAGTTRRAAASAVTQRASRILLARQDSAGRWSGRSLGDVTLDAEALLVREFLGVCRPELTRAAAQQIRSMQQPDGNWIGGESGDLAASVLAYLALRLAGDPPGAYHLAVAAAWIRDAGGLAGAGLVTSGWLAVFGLTGWDEVRVPAPEMVYLPARYAPGDGAWTGLSRHAVVTLTVVGTLRPVRQLEIELSELRPGGYVQAAQVVRAGPAPVSPGPASVAQRAALRQCGQWLISWQQRTGLPVGNRPYSALSLVALRALGYPLRHPVVSGGLSWLDSVTARPRQLTGPLPASAGTVSAPADSPDGRADSPDGRADSPGLGAGPASLPPAGTIPGVVAVEVGGAAGLRRIAAMRQPPLRDTSLTVRALAEAGLPPGHPAVIAAGVWLLAQRITGPSDSARLYPGAAASGWSFGRDGYPLAADTAEVLIALSRIALPGMTGKPAITATIRWLNGTQARDGSWGHSAVTTAVVVQALATHGVPDARALRRGVVWLVRAQLADGSWPGRAGSAELHATTEVLAALLVAGVVPGKSVVGSAIDWLLSRQNPDGGWASGAALPDRDAEATAPQPGSDTAGTARAVAALLAACCAASAGAAATAHAAAACTAAGAGADWLMRTQRADGGWSDRADPAGKPPGRTSARRRDPLLPGMLLPVAALAQYAASPGAAASSGAAGTVGAATSAGAAANAGVSAVSPEASASVR